MWRAFPPHRHSGQVQQGCTLIRNPAHQCERSSLTFRRKTSSSDALEQHAGSQHGPGTDQQVDGGNADARNGDAQHGEHRDNEKGQRNQENDNGRGVSRMKTFENGSVVRPAGPFAYGGVDRRIVSIPDHPENSGADRSVRPLEPGHQELSMSVMARMVPSHI